MFIITPIRNMLERKLGRSLRQNLGNGIFTIQTDNETGSTNSIGTRDTKAIAPTANPKPELSLRKMTLVSGKKSFLGIFPLFEVQETGSISFSTFIGESIRAAYARLTQELNQAGGKMLNATNTAFKGSLAERIGRAKKDAGKEAGRLTEKLNAEQLRTFIKTDRNTFRQSLLEELGKKGSNIFEEKTKKHLVELVLRVRKETAEELGDPNDDRSGPISLPTGTRFHIKKGKMSVFVIEQPPQTRTLKIMDNNGEKSEMYQLSFPYVIFFVVLRGRKSERMYVLFRNRPLRSVKDELLCPALPNIWEDFHVCFAPSAAKDSSAEMAEESIGNFWGGRFIRTHDMGNLAQQISLESWADRSRKESLFGLSHPWRPARVTVADMIATISSDFVTESAKQRDKNKDGQKIMSTLDTVVNTMTASIANEMKEACFNLVPSWNIDDEAFKKVAARFNEIVSEFGNSIQDGFGKEIDGLLSDETLKSLFETAAEQTVKSMNADASKPIEAAREAFMTQLTEGNV